MNDSVKEYLASIGSKGGQARSAKKLSAIALNLQKANETRKNKRLQASLIKPLTNIRKIM